MNKRLADLLMDIDKLDRSRFVTKMASVLRSLARDMSAVSPEEDKLSTALSRARATGIHAIGQHEEEMVVFISVEEFAEILLMARRQSFGEELEAAGFQPMNRKVRIRPAVNRIRRDQ